MAEILPKTYVRTCVNDTMSEVISMMFPTIRTLREGRDWTQQQVADMLYLNRRTYCAYENGAIAITPELLIQLAALYQTSVEYLLGLTTVKAPYPRRGQPCPFQARGTV